MLVRLLLGMVLFASALCANRLPIKIYTTASGIPRNSARCLVPDANGMLWICTSEGLVRFDGYQFRVFGKDQGLPSRSIFDVVPSRKGGYWLVTDAGVCRIPAGSKIGERCKPLDVDGPTGDFQQGALVEAPDGAAWIATADALFRAAPGAQKLERAAFRLLSGRGHLLALSLAPDGSLLIACDFAFYQWKYGDPAERAREFKIGASSITDVTQILPQSDGEIWLISPLRLYRMRGVNRGSAPEIDALNYPKDRWFRHMIRRADGSLWASGTGISHLAIDAGKIVEIENYSKDQGLPAYYVETFLEDRQGNLWGATDASGIFRIANSGFTVYTEADGLGTARIGAVFQSLRGDICVIHSPALDRPDALSVKIGSRFQTVKYQRTSKDWTPGWGWNQFALQSRDSSWWLASGAGLYHFGPKPRPQDLDGAMPTVFSTTSPLNAFQIFRVFEDSHSDLWVVTLIPNALLRRDHTTGQFHRFSSRENWPDDRVVNAMREAPGGTMWFGTYAELVRYRNDRFEIIAALPTAQVALVRDLYIDRKGRVWVATARYGLFRSDDPEADHPTFTNYTTRDGLASDSVRSITEDDAGLIYLGTVRGIDRIDPDAPIGSHRIRHFTTADGVPDNEQNVAFRDRDGKLWFGSLDGLAEFDPAKAHFFAPPAVYITRLRVRGEEIPLPWEGVRSFQTELAPDKNQFEIQYAGVDLTSVSSLRYQYRLDGIDHDWSQPVDDVSFNYASLPAGSFTFKVRALTADGQIGEPATFNVFVQAPVWRRSWFIALAAAALAAMVTALYQYRVRNLLAVERLRTRLAGDLHDDIGASLTQISILAELARQGETHVLDDVTGIARGMVAEMSDIVWAIKPNHDRFDALAHRMRRFAADTLGDAELDFDASSLPEDFSAPLECRRPLYLVFKEAANNVARHAGATKVVIRISLDHNSLRLTIDDNGRGFDLNAPREGEGINSIQRRMRDAGGSATWEPRPGGGTRFTAVLPLAATGTLDKLGGIFTRRGR